MQKMIDAINSTSAHGHQKTVVLTPNKRLAAFIQKRIDRSYQRRGEQCWLSTPIMPLNAWIQQIWFDCVERNQIQALPILNEIQTNFLWEEMIAQSSIGAQLLQKTAAAQLGMEAWGLLHQWQLVDTTLASNQSKNLKIHRIFENGSYDAQIFWGWAQAYASYCHENGLLDRHNLIDQLTLLCHKDRLTLPNQILLVGFDQLTPQLSAFLTSIQQSKLGCKVELLQLHYQSVCHSECSGCPECSVCHPELSKGSPSSGTIFKEIPHTAKDDVGALGKKIALGDTESELNAMAQWAKEQLALNPTTTIACVVPDLANIRAKVEKIFTKLFFPQDYVNLQQNHPHSPFNISIGQSLLNYPMIATAFRALHLVQQTHPFLEDLTYIIRSPFLAGAEIELSARAQLDLKLRSFSQPKISYVRLMALAKATCPILVKHLNAIHHERERHHERHHESENKNLNLSLSPTDWAQQFHRELTALGWPGERTLISEEHQQLTRWLELLKEFACLQQVCPLMTRAKALALLKNLIKNTIFQEQTQTAPIQILGVLEAAGLIFDQIWIMGVHDEIWPKGAKPNPFIPMELQRNYHLPRATAEGEFHYYQRLTQMLCQSAARTIFSYPQFEADRVLRPSPLIKAFPAIELEKLITHQASTIEKQLRDATKIEMRIDEYAPQISDAYVKGGSLIFKYQSACPFRAMAIFRLGAQQFPEIEPGLSARVRGSLLHQSLENVWRQLDNHQNLAAMDNEGLEAVIEEGIHQACHKVMNSSSRSKESLLLTLEKIRLQTLISRWLMLEKERPTFSIRGLEIQRVVNIGGIECEIKLDRVDEIAPKQVIILDYKTSRSISIADLQGERPSEPQLLLYCVTSDDPADIAGIAFAQINAQEQGFLGIMHEDTKIPGLVEFNQLKGAQLTWEAQIEYWRIVLEKLAAQFRSGFAKVDPKEGEKTCRHCHLQSLCRIDENIHND